MSNTGRRPIDPLKSNPQVYGFKYPDCEAISKLHHMAKRDHCKIHELINLALREYVSRHYEGQSQTTFDEFTEEGKKAIAFLEIMAFNKFSKYGHECKASDIHQYMKEQGLSDVKARVEAVVRVSIRLMKECGMSVWGA